MDIPALVLTERTRLANTLLALQQLQSARQFQMDMLAADIQSLTDQIAAIDAQVATLPAPLATEVTIGVADQAAAAGVSSA